MEKKDESNVGLIVTLIILSMGIIIFCCYLIYRQNIIIMKASKIKENSHQEEDNFYNFNNKENDQIVYGKGNTIFRKAILTREGNVCIYYKRSNEEEKQNCMKFNNPVYLYSAEKDERTYLYVIIGNDTVTEISFNNNFDINVVDKYHNLRNIIRIYTSTRDNAPVFTDKYGKEYVYGK